jgi:hypothetical protein
MIKTDWKYFIGGYYHKATKDNYIIQKSDLNRKNMYKIANQQPNSLEFTKGKEIIVRNLFQRDYQYSLKTDCAQQVEDIWEEGFKPELSPQKMLEMGVFEGKYLNDSVSEFPSDWFLDDNGRLLKTLSPDKPNIDLNYFKIKSRQSLNVWKDKGWIPVTQHRSAKTILRDHGLKADEVEDPDLRGWFEWFCRYYLGRRLEVIDEIQKKRWRAFKRHLAQVEKNCPKGDETCRPKQRQGLLQWSYNPLI